MLKEKLSELIKLAHDSVKNEVEPYKLESYKIILKSLIDNFSDEISSPKLDSGISVPKKESGEMKKTDDGFEKLAQSCNLNSDTLKDVFTIKDGKLKITASIPGSESQQRVIGTLCAGARARARGVPATTPRAPTRGAGLATDPMGGRPGGGETAGERERASDLHVVDERPPARLHVKQWHRRS